MVASTLPHVLPPGKVLYVHSRFVTPEPCGYQYNATSLLGHSLLTSPPQAVAITSHLSPMSDYTPMSDQISSDENFLAYQNMMADLLGPINQPPTVSANMPKSSTTSYMERLAERLDVAENQFIYGELPQKLVWYLGWR